MNSEKLSTISGINYSSVQPVFLIALLLSAKRPKSPHSQQERRPSACSAGNDNMHLPRAFLFIFLSSYDPGKQDVL